MSESIGFGFIGCGEIAVATSKGLAAARGAHLACAMDTRAELAGDLAAAHDAPSTPDTAELLAREDVDAVYIATPHFLHAPLAVQAMEAGKHVLVEKPIACTLEQADEMIAVSEKTGRALSVAFVGRYDPKVRKVRDLMASDALGKLVGLRLACMADKPETYWQGGYSGRAKTDWRTECEKAGGGILIMNLIHNIDRMLFVTGLDVQRVYAEYGTFMTPVEVEDMIAVTLRFTNGLVGNIEGSSICRGGGDRADRFYFSEGQIVWDWRLRVWSVREIDGLKEREWHELEVEGRGDGRKRLIEEFVAAIRAGKAPPITARDGRRALEIAVAAYASQEQGGPVQVA